MTRSRSNSPRTTVTPARDDVTLPAGHRGLHTEDDDAAPIFAREHERSGLVVLDESATLDRDGIAVNTDEQNARIASDWAQGTH